MPVTKLVTVVAPLSSLTAGGLPGTVKVGASFTALTVIETNPASFEAAVPSFTLKVKLVEPKKLALGVKVAELEQIPAPLHEGALKLPSEPFAGELMLVNVRLLPSGSCP